MVLAPRLCLAWECDVHASLAMNVFFFFQSLLCVQDGMTALMLASIENHAEVVRTLLIYDASVHAKDQVC